METPDVHHASNYFADTQLGSLQSRVFTRLSRQDGQYYGNIAVIVDFEGKDVGSTSMQVIRMHDVGHEKVYVSCQDDLQNFTLDPGKVHIRNVEWSDYLTKECLELFSKIEFNEATETAIGQWLSIRSLIGWDVSQSTNPTIKDD